MAASNFMLKVLLVCSTCSLLIASVEALYCYECNSTLDQTCQENFDVYDINNPNKPVFCSMYNARYCIKVTGLWGGVVGTHRFCSSRDLGYQCKDMTFPDHNRIYRACVFSCTANYCNAAPRVTTSYIKFSAFILFSLLFSCLM